MSTRRLTEQPGLGDGGRAGYHRGRPMSLWVEAMSPDRRRHQDLPVAMVTGGGRGLGRLVAQALAEKGFAVGLVARTGAELEESTEIIEAAGGMAAAVPVEIYRHSPLERRLRDLTTLRQHVISQLKLLEVVGGMWIDGADINNPLLNHRII